MGKTSLKNTVRMKLAPQVKMSDAEGLCPRCKYRGNVVSLLLDQALAIPVSVRFIVKITIGLDMAVKYCPTCGYFMVRASQEKVGDLLKYENTG